ncbi:unnamed protein product [Effrenium voratum]|uniref:Uncharacterized protein n=1 Tax=Effrenium voratum TaxID=2562239 RepID=A0AA36NLA9_9DINO|nr:unnamed protein product [Effrenium voratum]CAJ1407018.1 unnamed protein product [Effrenium voratum]CAJ1455449.1 unnamed protein product [Effrenium voratum]
MKVQRRNHRRQTLPCALALSLALACLHGLRLKPWRGSQNDLNGLTFYFPAGSQRRQSFVAKNSCAVNSARPARPATARPEIVEGITDKQASWERYIPALLIVVLVLQKCGADALTWFTKAKLGLPYSGSNASLVSELLKFPLLLLSVVLFQSAGELAPTIREAFTKSPFALWWVGLFYAAQSIMYFVCLQCTSAAAYQVLSQTKMIFTAGFMWQMLGKRFSRNQLLGLMLLVLGTVSTTLAELSEPVMPGARPWLGAALAVLSALLSALPNVFYEGVLKEQKNQWVTNLQLTAWISIWLCIIKGSTALVKSGGFGIPHLADLLYGFTPLVWVIVLLKTLNCVVIPACLKYGDNILYGYAKPVSIALTCLATTAFTRTPPSMTLVAGVILVALSIIVYSKADSTQPSQKADR